MNTPGKILTGLTVAGLLVVVAILTRGMWRSDPRQAAPQAAAPEPVEPATMEAAAIRTIVVSEELLLELTPVLGPLAKDALNLRLPGPYGRPHFADKLRILGRLAPGPDAPPSDIGEISLPWMISDEEETTDRDTAHLWRDLFSETRYLDNAKFYFVRGEFRGDSFDEFDSIVGFDALAKYRNGRSASLHADIKVGWIRSQDDPDAPAWRIRSWNVTAFETKEVAEPLFAEVLQDVLRDRRSLARAVTSTQERFTSNLLNGRQVDRQLDDKYPFFFAEVSLEHPGISVVDINQDGFDDLYVAMQHDPNLLLRNNGDGTFEEAAADYGLDLGGGATSALFADFDNDGDPDLFLGRARHRSRYFVNESGRFIEQSEQRINTPLPYMVSSVSAADYNGDGLLDLYLSTYSPIEDMSQLKTNKMPVWAMHYLTSDEFAELKKRFGSTHSFLGRPGPPNLLLKNAGGGNFVVAEANEQLQLWRKSFQASWCDFDADGDPDVYVSNDFGPDNFLRNDGKAGFTDITREAGFGTMGFGMGVSWTDYDNDGRMDLYVSNMFSKAGRRITAQVPGIDPRFREMAEGNFLYRQNDGKFSLVSGLKPPALQVAKAGWSWGGQFLDVDNDGFRDLYAASGFYTAPPDVALEVDL